MATRVEIKSVDWRAVGRGELAPPRKVVPAQVNSLGDGIEQFSKEGYDGFVVTQSGSAWWCLQAKPSAEHSYAITCYTLEGNLVRHRFFERPGVFCLWMDYEHPPEKAEDIIRDAQPKPEPEPEKAKPVELEDLSKKPFDPVAMCRQNDQMRGLYDSRATVKIPWLKKGQRRY